MIKTRSFQLDTGHGRTIHGFVDSEDDSTRRPVVVICHGFKGFMEWGFFPYLANLLAERGFAAVRFNFTGSGMKPGDQLVTDPESFRQATFSSDVEDLVSVLQALGTDVAPDQADAMNIGLIGHSRGGGTAVLTAAMEAYRDCLKALVTWAAVSTFDRLSEVEKDLWRQNRVMSVVNGRTGQELPVALSVLEDLERRGDALEPLVAARRLTVPWLVVHGGRDETVDSTEAQRLVEAAESNASLMLLDEANHTFGAQHPFVGPTPDLIAAMNATQTWFRRHLGSVVGGS